MFSLKTKRMLWAREKGKCFYCGIVLSWDAKTIDHVIPKSKGGPHRAWNLVISCHDCNKTKGDTDPTPAQLDLVLRRKILHESRVSIGQAIQLCKQQAENNPARRPEVDRLINLQREVSQMILVGALPTDFVSMLSANGVIT